MPHDGHDDSMNTKKTSRESIVDIVLCRGLVTTFARRRLVLVLLLSAALLSVPLSAGAQMDPRAVAGIPLPVSDVAAGTVVVRVIKGSLANNLPDQPVELSGAGATRTVKTDASGRAEFRGLPPGTRVSAVATVAGERLQSQEFAVPASGGTRLLLVATDPAAPAAPTAPATAGEDSRAVPAQPGTVVLGDQSRFVFELGDGSLSVFNILQLVNSAAAPVMPPRPVVFELPTGATGATILKDSSPQATVAGKKISVAGPFAPGVTNIQFAYSMPYSRGSLTIEQRMPVPLGRVIVLAQKAGEMSLTSAQVSEQREMPAEGQMYVVGQGPAVGAGAPLSFAFANLPHSPLWPRSLAVAIAVAILAAGAWGSLRARTARTSGQERLEKRRSQLFDQLTALEEQQRAGHVDAAVYASRRAELVAALERIYAEIDRQAA
jgi:hypothetical protein